MNLDKKNEFNIEKSINFWNQQAYIPNDGEGWSEDFGGSEAQWINIIKPRIRKYIPCKKIVEIACGWGRWSRFLMNESNQYYGFDFSKSAIDSCNQKYTFDILNKKASFYLNDGKNLKEIEKDSIDFIFSFDSLVHTNMDAIGAYLNEIKRILTYNGRAFLHHSNMMDYEESYENPHGRSPYVNAESVKNTAKNIGLNIICQEKISWRSSILNDCFTTIGKDIKSKDLIFQNFEFIKEIERSKIINNLYI